MEVYNDNMSLGHIQEHFVWMHIMTLNALKNTLPLMHPRTLGFWILHILCAFASLVSFAHFVHLNSSQPLLPSHPFLPSHLLCLSLPLYPDTLLNHSYPVCPLHPLYLCPFAFFVVFTLCS